MIERGLSVFSILLPKFKLTRKLGEFCSIDNERVHIAWDSLLHPSAASGEEITQYSNNEGPPTRGEPPLSSTTYRYSIPKATHKATARGSAICIFLATIGSCRLFYRVSQQLGFRTIVTCRLPKVHGTPVSREYLSVAVISLKHLKSTYSLNKQ